MAAAASKWGKQGNVKVQAKRVKNCHFILKSANLAYFNTFEIIWGQTKEGKKIFLGANAPMPPVAPPLFSCVITPKADEHFFCTPLKCTLTNVCTNGLQGVVQKKMYPKFDRTLKETKVLISFK